MILPLCSCVLILLMTRLLEENFVFGKLPMPLECSWTCFKILRYFLVFSCQKTCKALAGTYNYDRQNYMMKEAAAMQPTKSVWKSVSYPWKFLVNFSPDVCMNHSFSDICVFVPGFFLGKWKNQSPWMSCLELVLGHSRVLLIWP